jgi:hypothetical protein
MKTKEEVLKHLKQTGYSKKSALKILGFLNAKEYTEIGESVDFTSGERTFEDFVNWFNSKEVKKTKLEAYKEIADFLMSNVKDVPTYWIEYLNDDIKALIFIEEVERESDKNLDIILKAFEALLK